MTTVVLLSGGLDSTVALYMAKGQYADVTALSVNYRQPHGARELASAYAIAYSASVPFAEINAAIPWPPMQGDVLVGRNMMLLTMAAARAVVRGGGQPARVVIGACAADADAFPDCRPEFLDAAAKALTLGLGAGVEIVAPLIDRTKAQIVATAALVGAWDAVGLSWSCYRGGKIPCGECNACLKRAEGFSLHGRPDPAIARAVAL